MIIQDAPECRLLKSHVRVGGSLRTFIRTLLTAKGTEGLLQ